MLERRYGSITHCPGLFGSAAGATRGPVNQPSSMVSLLLVVSGGGAGFLRSPACRRLGSPSRIIARREISEVLKIGILMEPDRHICARPWCGKIRVVLLNGFDTLC